MKRLGVVVAGFVFSMSLVACGTYEDYEVTPLDDDPTPSCVAISADDVDEWDGDKKNIYTGRYCRED